MFVNEAQPAIGSSRTDIAIRLASLAEEQERLIEILDRNLPGRANREIQKRRHVNPLGPGWSWVIYSRSRDTIGGMASVLPRSFWVNSKKVLCGQVIEFAIEPPYRSLGPAVLLQKATFEPVNSGKVQFGYDCPPHDRGMSTFVRLGMRSVSDVWRYALLLRSDEYVEKRVGKSILTRPMVVTANVALRHWRSGRSVPGIEISPHDKKFDDEFSALDRMTLTPDFVRAGQAADELNWRYLKDPWAKNRLAGALGQYRVFVARRYGELLAFVIFMIQENGVAWIPNLFGLDLLDSGTALLEAVVDVCRREKVVRIDTLCSVQSNLSQALENVGFRRRERVYRVVPYGNAGQSSGLLNPRWPFTNFEVNY